MQVPTKETRQIDLVDNVVEIQFEKGFVSLPLPVFLKKRELDPAAAEYFFCLPVKQRITPVKADCQNTLIFSAI